MHYFFTVKLHAIKQICDSWHQQNIIIKIYEYLFNRHVYNKHCLSA